MQDRGAGTQGRGRPRRMGATARMSPQICVDTWPFTDPHVCGEASRRPGEEQQLEAKKSEWGSAAWCRETARAQQGVLTTHTEEVTL